jgi:iron complex outermembrane receptor protein
LFGQATYHVTDALRLIAGGRYTHASLHLDQNFNNATGPATNRTASFKTNKISYRFGAQYDVGARTMAYATVSRGFKGGQVSVPSNTALPATILLPEVPMSYELGMKSTLFGGWVMDLNAFYQKIGYYQAQQCLSDLVTKALSCSQRNIDGVKSKGAEINFFGRVTQGLTLNTGFIYTHVVYPNGFLGTDGSNIGNTQLAYAPRYKFTLSGEYEHPVTASVNGFLAADTVWKSRIRYEANSVHDTTFRPHWMVCGRVGVRTSDDRFSAALFVRNLFNVNEPVLYQSGFPDNGANNIGAIYGPQSFRQVGISLDARF